MDRSQRHRQYLEVYRRQLRRELDAMGYGQAPENARIVGRQNRTGLPSWLVVTALIVATLGLASTLT
ncbi:MAG: hypothetical protein JSW55_13605 [Chloroflexota bacterium]|nr:MAG: hypothetical protein JSW55_13605 [Chloroflexota bacterium]